MAVACAIATLAVLGFGLFAMLQSPQVPYADAWRFLAHFLSEPFPRSVLGADNGHMELFPDLVRVAELQWMAADQRLQTAVGLLLALASWAIALRWLRQQALDSTQFWAIALVLALGLFWLGNFRALMHANETVHAYAVTLGLFAGARMAWRGGITAATLAAGCAVFASLSFGSGLAVFPALLLVLALRRAPWREWLPMCAALLGVLLLMLALRDGTAGSVAAPTLPVLLESLLRWLGGPPLFASWPLWDPDLATRVPTRALRALLEPVATGYVERAGPVMLARWPHLAWGLLGVIGFGWALWRAWRGRGALPALGAATAAFALCVGAMIVLVRAAYFVEHADQLLAPRYLVWSSLFWVGLALVLIDAIQPRRAAAWALFGFALLLPSQMWMFKLGQGQRETAERVALAAAVGVLDPALPMGENVPADLRAAVPLLWKHQASVFAWRETRQLEQPATADRGGWVEVVELNVRSVDNLLGEPGRRVEFAASGADAQRLLLIDPDGSVRGLAQRERDGRWLGWMRGAAPLEGVRAARLEAP
jgi:hypothetical protein